LTFIAAGSSLQGNEAGLQAGVEVLRQGGIIAVKGVGGYHLMCDARNRDAIERLRQRKHRPDKPFAVLFSWQGQSGTDQVRQYLQADDDQLAQLAHVSRAIVLIPGRTDSSLADNINPGLVEVGAMLPYSPLHYLISHDFGGPLVATSANFTGEPVITDNDEAQQRLAGIVDAFLHHDRPILRPADDTVLRIIDRQPQNMRVGRGSAPLELQLPFRLQQPLLAVGGHMKNTIALAWQDRVVISPHIGDLSSARSLQVFEQVINDLQALYEVFPKQLICDRHPEYASHRWARQHCEQAFKTLIPVYHHHAHASAFCGEYPEQSRWLVFTWDGTGFGPDQSIWGGEALLGYAGSWQRLVCMRPFSVLGGDRVATDPWRSAAALWQPAEVDSAFAHQAWQNNQGCFTTSAVGRLFDAAAALVMGIQHCSFDGQAPMNLEQISAPLGGEFIELPLEKVDDSLQQVDWSPLLPMLLDEQRSAAERSSLFHSSMAMSLLRQAERLREQQGEFAVGLSGGVFQNKKLTEYVLQLLREQGFNVFTTRQIPCNDAGISYGQILEVHRSFVDDQSQT
jgi:hydrogenase maturation protein HypF